LVQGAFALVGSVGPLPAANYLITAKATVENFIHDGPFDCFLRRDDGVEIDSTVTSTSTDSPFASVVNAGLTSLTAAQSVNMFCGTFGGISGSDVSDVAITAVQVGEATIGCSDLAFRCPGE